jgi:hypothetical protein
MRRLASAFLAVSLLGVPALAQDEYGAPVPLISSFYSPGAIKLRTAMRRLGDNDAAYSRNLIISTLADLPDEQSVMDRLLQNRTAIGNALKVYYGDAAGDQLGGLLRDNATIALALIRAEKTGDKAALAAAQQQWGANAMDIGTFLNRQNAANWPSAGLAGMLQKYLDLTAGEVTARLDHNWPADLKLFGDGQTQILLFADTIVEGIIRQFPDKFPGMKVV